MELKERILTLLELLKKAGFSRESIEKKLSLAPKGLTQSLSRGGSEKLYTSLELLSRDLLKNSTKADGKNTKEAQPGFIDTNRYLEMLETQNEFLRRNFETSLMAIVEGQEQTGIQLKALSWFSALAAHSGDEKKAEEAMLKIGNKIAAYEGVNNGAGNLHKDDSKRTSVQRKRL